MSPILTWQSVSDPYGLQEASTEAPHSSNMDNNKEKNVISHLETGKQYILKYTCYIKYVLAKLVYIMQKGM